MNPYRLKDVFNYLTSNNQLLKRKLKLGTSEIPIPPKKDSITTIEAINRFNKANPRVDTTSLKPLSVKQSNVKQSNVDQADEGVIQGAFDTATREAQSEGFPAPKYEAFKKRYLRKNMKADGGRIGYKDGPKMFDVQASGSKSGKQQIKNAPEGITSDKETINAILTMDIPLTEKINLIGNLKYGKFRDKIEYKDNEIFLDDPASYRNRNIGLDYNRGGEGFSGSATVGDEGPEFNIRYKKSFADGGMLVQPSDDGSRPGYKEDIPKNRKGQVMELPSEMKKLWKITNPGKDWATGTTPTERGNFKKDFPRKKKIFEQTKGLVSLDELSSILTEELGEEIGSKKITGRYGVGKKTKLAEVIDNALFKGSFGSIQGGSGTIRYYKKPSKKDIKKILKADVIGDVRINSLKSNTIKNVLYLNKKFGDVYKAGEIPDIETILKGTKMTHGSAGTATARLAQIYNGHKFRNEELNSIRINKNTASKMFQIIENTPFGNPYRNGLYQISLDMIDQKLGNKKGTFQGLKKQATKILKENKIPVYDNKKGTKAFGFNINEIAGVTGSAKSKAAEFSQFIDVMEGNLNQKTLTNFQGQLSIARQNIENNPDMLSSESKRINKLARNLEGQYDVELPRLRDPDATKYFSPTRIKELNAQGIDIVKAAERAGYTVEMPNKAITINEFVDQSTPQAKKILQNIQSYSKLKKCRVNQADGGRIGFAYSDECIRDGLKEQKIEAQKGNKKAAQELVQVGKVATRAGLLKNLLGPGAILGEAVYEGAVIGNKVLGGTPKDIAWAESYLSYLDPRKYTPEGLDPLKMKREDMITREDFNDPDYAEGESKTIDGPNANILRSGFAAQDQVSAFNEAVNERERAKKAGRLDQYNPAAADVREQGRFVDQSKDIISSDAFQEATKQAQEYIQAQTGENMFPYNQLKQSIGKYESGEARDLRREREKEMQALGGTYLDYKNPFTKKEYEDLARKEGILPSDRQYTDKFFTEAILNPMKFEQLMETPGFKGASEKFASGGIASLTKTIPPESGPTPHGLRYPYNNVKKIKE